MVKLTHEQYREAGIAHLQYMRELLERDGEKATLHLHAAHMRSLLAAASTNKNVPA
ncbi:hypothetical protein [Bradyrhizobium japonicum]|jgi:hypothetical protein|uniref:hypothetical protein n=1 Tax=Bradyrhizobium japonicum TaxID=375 RepID=UPI001E3BE738|nr:hypothetical protein [Bradyrhizobium japonicum]MCD9825333.1 hypothetical protein [Bradyrhizobium japonicum]MCD9898310.1 hypothetical protein [Bradyrhizobium japonicum]MCP1766098.1 hypothetical protein [Bradyrhizobium japonicum]MCP1788236.1 hypothetical protein [Bradyrhizobium japonicum]MCP1810111.1 hypothetical protein [Bradyrhizobium japonicum]